MCPRNIFTYWIISDFDFSSGVLIFISASSLFIVVCGLRSLIFIVSTSLFSCFVICSSTFSSPLVVIVIRDSPFCSDDPTVMLSMLKFLLVNNPDIL